MTDRSVVDDAAERTAILLQVAAIPTALQACALGGGA